ncbi:hypothetical protein B5M42_003185 [Paenibacillus athensensis]|uniref:Uncharacterized protein n=1 Tax=Paenibacillus athensensis TaxID=1967502 RepID=A0A4Y8PWW3_9BACL|nr:hypothetical protein [Paenibacillus athensensis]MCD1257845.1 hypothetical protein [Paenibacillus athensensis]
MGNLYNQTLQQLGLSEAEVHKGTLRTGDMNGPCYLSSNSRYASAIAAKSIVIQSVADLQAIVGGLGNGNLNTEVPQPWPETKSGLSAEDFNEADDRSVYAALRAMLGGRAAEVQSYADAVNQRYFPMRANVYAVENIVVTKDNPLIIEPDGHDPVPVVCDTLTLEPGGQIICNAPVIMTVNTFIKN